MSIYKTPNAEVLSFQERARFNFVWRITLVFSIVVLALAVMTFFTDRRFFYFYLTVIFITAISLFFLWFTKTYKPVARILYFTICIILNLSVFMVPDAFHIQEALWMVVLILCAFFTLGNAWGIFYLIANTVLYAFYFNLLFAQATSTMDKITPDLLLFMSIEFGIAMFLIGFVMFQYGLVNKYALKNTSDAYEALKAEKQIVEHQNKEKTILLQEIHHRVKNNLQVIVSLLRLQSRDLKSEEAKESFQDAITRILTMSLIHQKLYEKESLMNIDIKDYLSTLMKNLIETNATQENIQYNVESSLKSVNAKTIVPLGLIINELVSNSLKHAFDQSGRIELILSPESEHTFKMIYFDDGRWVENQNTTFGTQLIDVFTEQLNGTFERVINDEGTFYYFSLKED
ncbi:MAG TPA: sensor histidine kinase [Brumimicrobium sp.]|nr:sensor histidine kinase [Brumimicrobium sp.]